MSEHKENHPSSPEIGADMKESAAKRSMELRQNPEKNPENQLSASAERSKVEALFSKESSSNEKKKPSASDPVPSSKRLPRAAGKKEREASYQQTMSHLRSELPVHERAFSRIIHSPIIESVSEAAGSTVARPNALLAGSLTAFIFVTIIYVVARNMGYVLSGFETIGAFVLGWLLGIIYDYVRIAIRGKAD
jgi:hypothetical protein